MAKLKTDIIDSTTGSNVLTHANLQVGPENGNPKNLEVSGNASIDGDISSVRHVTATGGINALDSDAPRDGVIEANSGEFQTSLFVNSVAVDPSAPPTWIWYDYPIWDLPASSGSEKPHFGRGSSAGYDSPLDLYRDVEFTLNNIRGSSEYYPFMGLQFYDTDGDYIVLGEGINASHQKFEYHGWFTNPFPPAYGSCSGGLAEREQYMSSAYLGNIDNYVQNSSETSTAFINGRITVTNVGNTNMKEISWCLSGHQHDTDGDGDTDNAFETDHWGGHQMFFYEQPLGGIRLVCTRNDSGTGGYRGGHVECRSWYKQ